MSVVRGTLPSFHPSLPRVNPDGLSVRGLVRSHFLLSFDTFVGAREPEAVPAGAYRKDDLREAQVGSGVQGLPRFDGLVHEHPDGQRRRVGERQVVRFPRRDLHPVCESLTLSRSDKLEVASYDPGSSSCEAGARTGSADAFLVLVLTLSTPPTRLRRCNNVLYIREAKDEPKKEEESSAMEV
jgi:hypothetical protein